MTLLGQQKLARSVLLALKTMVVAMRTAGDGAGSAAMTVVVMLTMMLIVTATIMVIEADSAADGVAGRAASVWKGALRMQPSALQMAQPSNGALGEESMVQPSEAWWCGRQRWWHGRRCS